VDKSLAKGKRGKEKKKKKEKHLFFVLRHGFLQNIKKVISLLDPNNGENHTLGLHEQGFQSSVISLDVGKLVG